MDSTAIAHPTGMTTNLSVARQAGWRPLMNKKPQRGAAGDGIALGACRRLRRDACARAAGGGRGDAETRRHADLYDPGGRAAELRRASRKHVCDDPCGGAVL